MRTLLRPPVLVGAWGLLLVGLLAACGGAKVTPTPPLSFEQCQGFLTLDEVERSLERDDLVEETLEVTDTARTDNPNVVGVCVASFRRPEKPGGILGAMFGGITLTAAKFDSAEASGAHYQVALSGTEAGPGVRLQKGALGADSYSAVIDAEGLIGSVVTFRRGVHVVQVLAIVLEDEGPAPQVSQLTKLARLVEERLP